MMDLGVPACPSAMGPLTAAISLCFFWAEKRQSRKDEMEMDTRMKMAGELRKGGLSKGYCLLHPPACPCPCHPHDCTGQTGTLWRRKVDRHEFYSCFSSSLFFTDSSGKIISGPHTAWTTEVSAVTCPRSGLVHWWQFLGTTGDPTETFIGSSCFVFLPPLVSHRLQVLLKPLSRVLLCCDVEHLMCIILEEFNSSISQLKLKLYIIMMHHF